MVCKENIKVDKIFSQNLKIKLRGIVIVPLELSTLIATKWNRWVLILICAKHKVKLKRAQ